MCSDVANDFKLTNSTKCLNKKKSTDLIIPKYLFETKESLEINNHSISYQSNLEVPDTNASDLKPSSNVSMSIQNESNDFSTFGLIKKGLRISNLNVCHLLPKLDEIHLLLHERRSVDILSLCETFLNENVQNSTLDVDGFTIERKDRQGKLGGGILIYISNTIIYKRRYDLENTNIEAIWIEICLPNSTPILYCSAYRPLLLQTAG